MRPARSSFGGGPRRAGFDFTHTVAVKLAIALGAVSVLAWVTPIGGYLVLLPRAVLSGLAVWQPLTYAFLEDDPMGVIFGALILWQMGSALEATWGSRRLLAFSVGVTALAGVATVLLAIPFTSLRSVPYVGGWVMGGALWVAYGLSYGRGQTNFWGMPVSGNVFAAIGAAFVLLTAARFGIAVVVPKLLALGFTFLYVRGFSPRMLWLRFQSARLHRQLKGRSRHLRVVGRDRNMPSDSDRFIH